MMRPETAYSMPHSASDTKIGYLQSLHYQYKTSINVHSEGLSID